MKNPSRSIPVGWRGIDRSAPMTTVRALTPADLPKRERRKGPEQLLTPTGIRLDRRAASLIRSRIAESLRASHLS